MRINTTTSGHVGPSGSQAVPADHVRTVERALAILKNGMRTYKGCNDSFANLSGGRTFQTMLDDGTIWLNYDPSNNVYGWVKLSSPRDIVIGQLALRMGRWSTAATIVHEAAHLNGAPGGLSHDAELRVKECRMMSPAGPYDPTITG